VLTGGGEERERPDFEGAAAAARSPGRGGGLQLCVGAGVGAG
jgi:hypothetical protein